MYVLPVVPRYAVISVCLGLFVASPAEMLSRAVHCATRQTVPLLRGGDSAGSTIRALPSSRWASAGWSLQRHMKLWELFRKQ